NGMDENPYHGFLAWADYIIVTSDSASMISEAATTGKPVYMEYLEGGSTRFDRFHNDLLDKGMIRKFEGKLEPYSYTPLNDAAMVADGIRKRWKT
ncbi:MAG: mitochondrial fission ELM1 family protein, partial [Proteobacteria bacterium]|nr:mitochondrial fission ELM1 family protein [Pseudomonadota bacterium]